MCFLAQEWERQTGRGIGTNEEKAWWSLQGKCHTPWKVSLHWDHKKPMLYECQTIKTV